MSVCKNVLYITKYINFLLTCFEYQLVNGMYFVIS